MGKAPAHDWKFGTGRDPSCGKDPAAAWDELKRVRVSEEDRAGELELWCEQNREAAREREPGKDWERASERDREQ